jgi:glycosyltransferase involved in cell wall biosynthesis
VGLDVLIVSLGSTFGLRAADDALAASLGRAGADVEVVRARRPREVRTLALTDLAWALAARRAAAVAPPARAVLYSTTTAALLAPRPGAIRFDAAGSANRPGRHGLWQRPVEARRLRAAPLLVPWSAAGLAEAGTAAGATPAVVVPVPVDPSGTPDPDRPLAAITYATNPAKKGLDVVLRAWAAARRDGEELLVAGVGPGEGWGPADGVRFAGRLDPAAYRAQLRRARVFVTAPRREDHGLAQLEALADGCHLVTTPAPGPYVALAHTPWVAPAAGLAGVLRAALDAPPAPPRVLASTAAVDAIVATELLPALLAGRS